jgi:hypothetical protein
MKTALTKATVGPPNLLLAVSANHELAWLFNAFSGLKAGDFLPRSLTFQAGS